MLRRGLHKEYAKALHTRPIKAEKELGVVLSVFDPGQQAHILFAFYC
jgi:hypothetical protein